MRISANNYVKAKKKEYFSWDNKTLVSRYLLSQLYGLLVLVRPEIQAPGVLLRKAELEVLLKKHSLGQGYLYTKGLFPKVQGI